MFPTVWPGKTSAVVDEMPLTKYRIIGLLNLFLDFITTYTFSYPYSIGKNKHNNLHQNDFKLEIEKDQICLV